jgi:hypothetical protein
MSKKKLVFSSLLFSSIPLAAAQGTITQSQGVLPMISEVLGLNISNPYALIGILATVGVMDVVTYIVLKNGAKKLEIEDTVLPGGHDNSRNILAIMSTLITLSIFGTGFAMNLISGFQGLFIMGFTFLLIGGIIFMAIGGAGGLLGGGLWTFGKSSKAAAEGVEDGVQGMNKAAELLDETEAEEKEGRERGENGDTEGERKEERDAEMKLNRVLEVLDSVEDDFQEALEVNKERINDAINDLEEAEEDEEVEEKAEEDITQRVQRAHTFIQHAVEQIQEEGAINPEPLKNGRGSYSISHTGYGGAYGLLAVEEDMEMVEKRLNQIVSNIQDEEGFIGEGLKELLEAANEVITVHKYTNELKELLKEAEEDTEFMERLAEKEKFKELFSEARDADEYEESDLEPKLERLEEEERELYEALEKADKLVEKHLQLNRTVITMLENKTKKPSKTMGIITSVGELYSDLGDLLSEANTLGATKIENLIGPESNEESILFYVSDISDHVDMIDSELNSEYKKEQEEIKELENYLSKW